MKVWLGQQEKRELEREHKTVRDRRVADRIKAILLAAEGWTEVQIAQALRVHVDTVGNYLTDYMEKGKRAPENNGSSSKLNEDNTQELIAHLRANVFVALKDICAHVKSTYGVSYTTQGMYDWMKRHNFRYKQPKGVPAKADPEAQEAFKKIYEGLKRTVSEDEPILFGDSVHPTQATKITHGWIPKGEDHIIGTTGARERMNITAVLNLETMQLVRTENKKVNTASIVGFLEVLRAAYPKARRIHLIWDKASYHCSKETKEAAQRLRIKIHYLPPYSPNLNPIERVWKVMNEMARNNRYFRTAKEFRATINEFFDVTWPSVCMSMIDRINDCFETIKQRSA